ncbi:MAG: metal-dependent transcriptional regulator [Christensenellaceae bacterium]
MNKGPVKSNQSEEDYLESILLLSGKVPFVHRIEVAKRMGVSQAAVNKAVKLLCERNYVYEDGKHLYLTEEGREYASAVYEKHCIIREFLFCTAFLPPRRRKTRAKWNISSAGRLLP